MTKIDVGNLKTARETLCAAQKAVVPLNGKYTLQSVRYAVLIQEMIDQIDVFRPLGPNGKHGDRHTENCGCEDKYPGF